MSKPDACPLCNEQIQDESHTYWTCPYIRNHHQDCKEITDSQHLTDQLDENQIAFFNRGILNQEDLQPHIDYAPLEEYPLSIGMCNSHVPPITHTDLWLSGYYFGDGSGGKFSKQPTLTRAGVGVHHVDLQHNPYFNASAPLPGDMQTNNRAELYAVLLVTRHAELAAAIDFFTDSKITKDTFYKGLQRAKLASNSDLWIELLDNIDNKGIVLNIHWMPSHTDTDPKKAAKAPEWMLSWHVNGNKEADNLAAAAALLHQLPPYVTDPITQKLTNLKLIQKRLIEITKLLPKRDSCKPNTTDIKKLTKRDILLEKIASSNHRCLIHNNRITCTVCANSIPREAEPITDS